MKMGLLVIGALILVGTYFFINKITTITYVMYGAYGLGGLLVLAGLFGRKRY